MAIKTNSTFTTGTYTKKEENKLLKIPYVKGTGPHTEKLKALATELNRNFQTMWQKWYALHHKGYQKKSAGKVPKVKPVVTGNIVPVSVAKGKSITAYALEVGADRPRRGDQASTVALKNTLLPVLDAMLPLSDNSGVVHSVPIHTSERTTVRKWLSTDKHFKGKVFSMSPIADNKKMVRIYRRM